MTPMKKLKPFHKDFIKEYIACGYVGQRAYLKLKPYVKPKTAQVEASKLLSLPIIREELDRQSNKRGSSSIASREYLIQEAHDVTKEAREKGAYGAVIKGIELKGKLNRLFDRDEPEMEGYIKIIQMLQINTNTSVSKPEDEAIDITGFEAEEKGKE